MKFTRILSAVVSMGVMLGATVWSSADEKGLDNPRRDPYYNAMKDKKVVFVPITMGWDLTEGWAAVLRKQSKNLGYELDIRDPAGSTDAGTRALSQAITEKPDLLIVHNPDIQSYARLLKQAQKAGIKVLQVNMESAYATDTYIGADWIQIGEVAGQALVDHCGAGKGVSNKVAIVQGVPTGAGNIYQMRGLHNVLSQHPEIEIVSQQAANYDPSKARDIMATVLQQHSDLCGIMGVWDSQDVGVGAAVQDAGKTGKIFVVTSGGGSKPGCDNLQRGLFDELISYNVPLQGDNLRQAVAELLQSREEAGVSKISYFTPLTIITKKNANARNCWTLDDLL
ncbi:MAG: sugar ABC transporter substrate-binding protein [Notoacmeibacter sp.]|nr:sugar ABC transporter substrate-binding protein [Notoacmeibacter sp.]